MQFLVLLLLSVTTKNKETFWKREKWRESRGLLHWLVAILFFSLSPLMRFKWKPQWLNSCHTEPQIDIQFQSKTAQISTANQHLNCGLSQLLDHYAPLEWSQFPVNGIHAFAKRGSERRGCQRRKERNWFHIHLPKPFTARTAIRNKAAFVWEVWG